MQIKKKCQNYEIKKWPVFFAIERIRRKLSFKGRAKFLIVKGLKTIDISDFPSVEISVILVVKNVMDTDTQEENCFVV